MWHQAWIERVLFPAVVLMHQGALRQIHMSFCPGARVVAVKASETMKALSILSYWSQENDKMGFLWRPSIPSAENASISACRGNCFFLVMVTMSRSIHGNNVPSSFKCAS